MKIVKLEDAMLSGKEFRAAESEEWMKVNDYGVLVSSKPMWDGYKSTVKVFDITKYWFTRLYELKSNEE